MAAFEVTATTEAPYASICYLRCVWSDGYAIRASGVVVGYNDVLTALHAVYDDLHGGWAQTVTIIPGTDVSPFITEPFGEFTDVGSMVGRAPNWDLDGDGLLTQQESSGDLALLGLTKPIGAVTGWLPVADVASDFQATMAGYPAPQWGGTGLMAQPAYAQASSVGVYDMSSGLGPGASGGPLLYNADGVTSVAGVLSSGTLDQSAATYAGLFGAGTMQWLQQAIASDDTLLGLSPGTAPTSSETVHMGTAGFDAMSGGAGADRFTGLAGNDTIDGGAGIDTAVYAGPRAAYSVTSFSNGQIQVADSIGARDGTDLLVNVERVKFGDVSLAFDDNGSAALAYRLYQVAFDRVPDPGGLGFYMGVLDRDIPLRDIATAFMSSPEFQAKYGALDNAAFVTLLYENAFNREPDAGGYAFYKANLDNGAAARADMLVSFALSQEDHDLLIGAMKQGMAYT
jgi:V8-like Glu-specific endopeptidase